MILYKIYYPITFSNTTLIYKYVYSNVRFLAHCHLTTYHRNINSSTYIKKRINETHFLSAYFWYGTCFVEYALKYFDELIRAPVFDIS